MDINKPNDIFATSILDPSVNVNDLLVSGITPDNTSFFDSDTYKNNDFVKKAFTDEDGKFNELAFNKAYENAANLYTEMSNDKFLKNSLTYDPYDFMRPIDTKVETPTIKITQDINPYKSLYGRTGFNSVDEGSFSIRELAQQSKIFDTETGKFLDKSANDLGLFGSIFGKTLVYAQWDDDGEAPDPMTGRMVKHHKGEYKLNPEGNFYIETLGDRDVAGKQVVNPTDLITTDGSYFNKIDFFDSDGKDKSLIGTTFKTAAEIAPYLIPGFNLYYGTFKMVMGLAEALPSFYKSMEGIILGDSNVGNETDLWKAASKAQGFLAKYSAESFSDKGANSMWNYEQLSKMVSGTFSLIYELRAASNLSNMFFKVNDPIYANKLANIAEGEIGAARFVGSLTDDTAAQEIGKKALTKINELSAKGMQQSGMAKALSLGYMSLTSTADVYNQAIEGGYDRRSAGIAALLAAGGQYALLNNNRMSHWFLDDIVGFDREANRAAMRKAIMTDMPDIQRAVEQIPVNQVEGKKALAKVITKVKQGIENTFINPIGKTEAAERIRKNAIVWGVEGVTLHAATDAAKAIVDTMSWLGMTGKKGSFNTADNVLSSKGLETYLSTFIGGLVGGGLFELHRIKIEPFFDKRVLSPETDYSLLRMIANGKSEELKREIDSMTKYMGNSELSPIGKDFNGKDIYLADQGFTQANMIAEVSKKYIDYMDNLLNSENLKIDDETLVKKTILDEIRIKDLQSSGVDKFILSDFNEVVSDILNHKNELSQLPEDAKDRAAELTAKIKQKKEYIDDLLSGKKAEYYKGLSLFSLNKYLHDPFISLNVLDYAKDKYNVDYNSLPEDSGTLNKKQIKEEFDQTMSDSGDKKAKMKFMFSAFRDYIEKYSNEIGDYSDEKHVNSRKQFMDLLTQARLISPEEMINNSRLLNEFGLPKYTLKDLLSLPLGELLLKGDYIDKGILSKEEIDKVVESLNNISIPASELNLAVINSGIEAQKQENLKIIQNSIDKDVAEQNIPVEEATKKYQDQIDEINKLTPKLKNAGGKEILHFDLMYLNSQLKNAPYITSEVVDLIKDKVQKYIAETKKPVSDKVYITKEDFLYSFPEEEGFDLSPFNLDDIILKINKFKKDILDSNSAADLQKNLNSFKKFTNSFSNTILVNIMDNLTNELKYVDNTLVESEKLLKKEVIDNKLYDLLNKVNIQTFAGNGSKEVNILTVLRDEIKYLESLESPEDYTRGSNVINDLKQSLDTIKLVKAITSAMVNTSIETTNPYGFNVSMRNWLIKEERASEAEKYRVIDTNSYYYLNKELSRLENKIQFLVDLAENNNSTIATLQEEIKTNTVNLFLKTLTNVNNTYSPLNLEYEGTKLLGVNELNTIMLSNKNNEEKLTEIESTIHNNFNSLLEKYGLTVLDKIFEPFNNDDFKKEIREYADAGFTKSTESINSLDYFNHLHMLFSLNVKDFYSNYKNLLEKELSLQTDKKGPFFGQEYSIKFVEAYRNNKEIMSHSQKFIEKLLDNKRLFLKNSIIVTGSGGVGKTTVISNFAIRLNEGRKEEVLVSAPNDTVLFKLKNDISRGELGNVTSQAKEELFKRILGDNYDNFQDVISQFEDLAKKPKNNIVLKDKEGNNIISIDNFSKYEFDLHPDFINKLKNPFSTTNDTVLFLDEVSWISPLELKLLDSIAGQQGSRFYMIGLGDDLQLGYTLNGNPFSLESFYFLHPPKLKGVIRAQNPHKQDNIVVMETYLKNRLSDLVLNTTLAKDRTIELSYYDNIGLEGDYFVDNVSINDLLKLDKNKEVAVVVDKDTLPEEYKTLFTNAGFDLGKIQIIPKDKIQGREFDQILFTNKIEYDPKSSYSLFNAGKALYTMLSRGRVNTIIEGNNQLLSDLGIGRVRKETTSQIIIDPVKIDDLLQKRIENMKLLTEGYTPEKPIEKNTVNEVEKEASLNDTKEIEIDNTKTIELPPTNEHDGDGVFTLYSFYNSLNAQISKVDNKLTILERNGKTLGDMQIFEYGIPDTIKDNLSPSEAINQFIIAKNHILHGMKIPGTNIFSKVMENISLDNLVVRKVVNNEFNEPYGKQAHMLDDFGKERKNKIGTTNYYLAAKGLIKDLDGNMVESYVTLGALPNIDNATFRQNQPKNHAALEEIYGALKEVEELPVNVDLSPLTGVRIVYSDGTSKKPTNNTISITANDPVEFKKKLMEMFPGLLTTDLNTIEVFDDNVNKINETIKNTGYDLGVPKGDLKNPNALRFRPFIRVSYIDPNNEKVSKVMILNTRSRSLLEAKREYEETKQRFKETNKQDADAVNKIKQEDFPVLINRYAGIKLFNDVIKELSGNKEIDENTGTLRDKADIITDKVLKMELDSSEKGSGLDTFETFKNMLDILKKSNYDLKNVSEQDMKELLGKIKGQTRLSNIGLRLLDALTEADIEQLGDKEVYYNPIWKSTHSETGKIIMDGKFIKYFKLDAYLESPIFKTPITLKEEPFKPTEPVKPTPEEIISTETTTNSSGDIRLATKLLTPFIANGEKQVLPVDFKSWLDPESLHIGIASMNNALFKIKNNLNTISDPVILKEIYDFLLPSVSNVLNNPSLVDVNKNINATVANNIFDTINMNASDALIEYADAKGIDLSNIFLNSTLLTKPNNIDPKLNAEICK